MIRRARLVPSALTARRGMLFAGHRRHLLVEMPADELATGVEATPEPGAGSPAPAEATLTLDPAVAPRRPAFGHPTF